MNPGEVKDYPARLTVEQHNQMIREEADYELAGGFVPGRWWVRACRDEVEFAETDEARAFWQNELDVALAQEGV